MKTIKAWHFVGKTLRDGRPVPKDGVWLKHEGEMILCKSGFHASKDPFDALTYAPGSTLCRVELRGQIQEHGNPADKLVANERRIIARMDADEMLRYFARMQALSVVHLYDAPDVVLDYLMTGDEKIRDAASAAAWEATRAAAWDAAWAAASAAARAAARDAASDAARAVARRDFNALVSECFEGVK